MIEARDEMLYEALDGQLAAEGGQASSGSDAAGEVKRTHKCVHTNACVHAQIHACVSSSITAHGSCVNALQVQAASSARLALLIQP